MEQKKTLRRTIKQPKKTITCSKFVESMPIIKNNKITNLSICCIAMWLCSFAIPNFHYSKNSEYLNAYKSTNGSIWGNSKNTISRLNSSLFNPTNTVKPSIESINGIQLIGNFNVKYSFWIYRGMLCYQSTFYWEWNNYKNSGYPMMITKSNNNQSYDTFEFSCLTKYPDLLLKFEKLKPKFVVTEAAITNWGQINNSGLSYSTIPKQKQNGSLIIPSTISNYCGQIIFAFDQDEIGHSGEIKYEYSSEYPSRTVDRRQFFNSPTLTEESLINANLATTYRAVRDNSFEKDPSRISPLFLISQSEYLNFNQNVYTESSLNSSRYRIFTDKDLRDYSPSMYISQVKFDDEEIYEIINEYRQREFAKTLQNNNNFWTDYYEIKSKFEPLNPGIRIGFENITNSNYWYQSTVKNTKEYIRISDNIQTSFDFNNATFSPTSQEISYQISSIRQKLPKAQKYTEEELDQYYGKDRKGVSISGSTTPMYYSFSSSIEGSINLLVWPIEGVTAKYYLLVNDEKLPLKTNSNYKTGTSGSLLQQLQIEINLPPKSITQNLNIEDENFYFNQNEYNRIVWKTAIKDYKLKIEGIGWDQIINLDSKI